MAAPTESLESSRRLAAPVADFSRVLLVAADAERPSLRAALHEAVPAWAVVEADGVERARFVLCLDSFDLLLIDVEAARAADARDWFDNTRRLPIALLTNDDADLRNDTAEGNHWLPRELARHHPPLLAAVLRRAVRDGEMRRQLRQADEALADYRRQVGRLVNRLWEAVPSATGSSWFTQRHMLERLQEEVERFKRHGGPLTIVLGELLPGAGDDADQLATWAAERIGRWKRRSDVAGQYGPRGFMMVLPRTPEIGAQVCCRRLRTLLEEPASPLRGPLRACFGVAAVDTEGAPTIAKLLRQAEERLEAAKGSSIDG